MIESHGSIKSDISKAYILTLAYDLLACSVMIVVKSYVSGIYFVLLK